MVAPARLVKCHWVGYIVRERESIAVGLTLHAYSYIYWADEEAPPIACVQNIYTLLARATKLAFRPKINIQFQIIALTRFIFGEYTITHLLFSFFIYWLESLSLKGWLRPSALVSLLSGQRTVSAPRRSGSVNASCHPRQSRRVRTGVVRPFQGLMDQAPESAGSHFNGELRSGKASSIILGDQGQGKRIAAHYVPGQYLAVVLNCNSTLALGPGRIISTLGGWLFTAETGGRVSHHL